MQPEVASLPGQAGRVKRRAASRIEPEDLAEVIEPCLNQFRGILTGAQGAAGAANMAKSMLAGG